MKNKYSLVVQNPQGEPLLKNILPVSILYFVSYSVPPYNA